MVAAAAAVVGSVVFVVIVVVVVGFALSGSVEFSFKICCIVLCGREHSGARVTEEYILQPPPPRRCVHTRLRQVVEKLGSGGEPLASDEDFAAALKAFRAAVEEIAPAYAASHAPVAEGGSKVLRRAPRGGGRFCRSYRGRRCVVDLAQALLARAAQSIELPEHASECSRVRAGLSSAFCTLPKNRGH